jgi:hypothetical protein
MKEGESIKKASLKQMVDGGNSVLPPDPLAPSISPAIMPMGTS